MCGCGAQVLPDGYALARFEEEADYHWENAFNLHTALGGPSSGKVFRNQFRTDGVCMDVIHTRQRATGAEAGAQATKQANIMVRCWGPAVTC